MIHDHICHSETQIICFTLFLSSWGEQVVKAPGCHGDRRHVNASVHGGSILKASVCTSRSLYDLASGGGRVPGCLRTWTRALLPLLPAAPVLICPSPPSALRLQLLPPWSPRNFATSGPGTSCLSPSPLTLPCGAQSRHLVCGQ